MHHGFKHRLPEMNRQIVSMVLVGRRHFQVLNLDHCEVVVNSKMIRIHLHAALCELEEKQCRPSISYSLNYTLASTTC